MKDFTKSHNIADQSNKLVPKSHKHDANLQKNTTLYFQIGLIMCLLATYGLFEMKFETKSMDSAYLEPLDSDDYTYDPKNYIPEPDMPKSKPVKKQVKKVITPKFAIIENTDPIDPVVIDLTPEPTKEPIDPNALGKIEKPADPVNSNKPFDLTNVEIVPVYPGCEKMTTNKDRIKCMNEKIGRLVQRKFDTDIASKYGLSGKQRITVQFKIDQNGNVTDILTRAPHPGLEKEANRVTNKIPQMQPGYQSKKPVSVIYNLPIVFNAN
ncbi:protein TonB [Formosa sp. Hel1_31_208]|uniref:energy transducer TonB n=1 Tax=Formosa sp. Hel1_31_208 TaxID=1798225 RepID=UPI00087CA004|nr:energy transducer TonB [Formosa sp. Hel1_31_208]SDR67387.1 protein TonB [Formosa sp. Hel1_31_208]